MKEDMSVKEKLIDLILIYMTEEEAEALLNLYHKLTRTYYDEVGDLAHEDGGVMPTLKERATIEEYEAMSEAERMAGSITHEELCELLGYTFADDDEDEDEIF